MTAQMWGSPGLSTLEAILTLTLQTYNLAAEEGLGLREEGQSDLSGSSFSSSHAPMVRFRAFGFGPVEVGGMSESGVEGKAGAR